MAVSKAQQKAVTKYVKNRYDRFGLTMPKGNLDCIKAHAEAHSESVNGFINRAITEAMERDTSQQPVGAPARAANPLEGKLLPLTRSKPHRKRHRPQERICPHSWHGNQFCKMREDEL